MQGKDVAGLSNEVKARLRGCETPGEMMALAREEGYELSDEELEGVSGGWSSCSSACSGVNCDSTYGPSIE